MSAAIEIRTERDRGLTQGEDGQVKFVGVVRVLYREPPTRRWTRFVLVPDEGQSLEELEEYAEVAAAAHAKGGIRAAS